MARPGVLLGAFCGAQSHHVGGGGGGGGGGGAWCTHLVLFIKLCAP